MSKLEISIAVNESRNILFTALSFFPNVNVLMIMGKVRTF